MGVLSHTSPAEFRGRLWKKNPMLRANRGASQRCKSQVVIKGGLIFLSKHRLRGEPIKHWPCMSTVVVTLLQLQPRNCAMEWEVKYHVSNFQAISAYFILVLTSLLLPAEGASGFRWKEGKEILPSWQKSEKTLGSALTCAQCPSPENKSRCQSTHPCAASGAEGLCSVTEETQPHICLYPHAERPKLWEPGPLSRPPTRFPFPLFLASKALMGIRWLPSKHQEASGSRWQHCHSATLAGYSLPLLTLPG